MRNAIRGALVASAIPFLLVASTGAMVTPAQAQPADINFDAFHDQLSGYGDWLYSDRWGEVWRPFQQDQDPSWRPYAIGYWAYTDDYGWTWISNEGPWGDIAYHYGRWVSDPDDGWLWLPGYVWSPAWVVWRSSGPNVGWMPMPPDDAFLGYGGGGLSVNVGFGDWDDIGGFYGYSRWYGPQFDEARFGALWTFVPAARVADRRFRNFVVPRQQVVNIVRDSHNVTNYTVVNNTIINRSVNINEVRTAGGRPVAPVRAASVLRTTRWIAPVNKGEQVQAQMRQARPHGNGAADSAPAPTAAQIRTLSNRPIPARGPAGPNAPHHLFNQASAVQIQNRQPNGQPNGAAPPPNRQGRPPNSAAANNPPPAGPAGRQPPEQRGMPPVPPPQQNEAARRPPPDNRTPRQEFDRGANQAPAQHPSASEAMRPAPEQRPEAMRAMPERQRPANPPGPPPEARQPQSNEAMRRPVPEQRPEAMRAMPERQRPEGPPAEARPQPPAEAMRPQPQQQRTAAPRPPERQQVRPERPEPRQNNKRPDQ